MASMEILETELTKMLGIKFPIIMAPMFLVSNTEMVIEATRAGITGAIPSLNYRTDEEFRQALKEMKSKVAGPIGINLIVNKSNFRLKEQLAICVEEKIDFIITSLGNPKLVIEKCKKHGIKVFCDVTEEVYAKKVEQLGADALIAVNSSAGGHAGNMEAKDLIPLLKSVCNIPVISAGGVGKGEQLQEMLDLGACGISMGSIFIASEEAGVSDAYKEAIVKYGKDDIVMTDKLSGTPCTVINTPYVQEIGTQQNWLERLLNKHKKLKKYMKMLTFYKGMKSLQKAAFGATYKTLWCAGPSIEHVTQVQPVSEIVANFIKNYWDKKKGSQLTSFFLVYRHFRSAI
ncbi:nitronate monooxygenase [Fulvivirga maritima]|uniref:NAD(P)H-dependent flavin oxidoreductase n=1 Tax=Fulvivirga maritima TaxID=2904247 RepID=UPI001F360893|nr:nitronate monooxygenase [Fulvivirga maritima]UII28652.1 nitronate monooxygenase [Fulvivirga maritima]